MVTARRYAAKHIRRYRRRAMTKIGRKQGRERVPFDDWPPK